MKRTASATVEQGAVTSFLQANDGEHSDTRKEDLLNMLARIGRRQPSSLRKQQIIDKIVFIMQAVREGMDTLEEPEFLDDGGRKDRDQKAVRKELIKTSLSSWVMKPLVATAGMKEGGIKLSGGSECSLCLC